MKAADRTSVRANREWAPLRSIAFSCRYNSCVLTLLSSLAVADIYSFLWKAHDENVRVFKWTGKNDYVALCEPESISFGGGCVLYLVS